MRIPKEEYRETIKCLNNYEYNKKKVKEIEMDILGISTPPTDSIKATGISDTVFNKLMQLEEDQERKKCLKRYKIIDNVLLLVDNDVKALFVEEFCNKKRRWQVIKILHISESTYERRKSTLVYTTYEELKKVDIK